VEPFNLSEQFMPEFTSQQVENLTKANTES